VDEAILREDIARARSPPSPNIAPHSSTQYPDMLLINQSGETVTRLPTASRKKRNITLLLRRCADCKQEQTEMECPFMHVERELVRYQNNPAIIHLHRLFQCYFLVLDITPQSTKVSNNMANVPSFNQAPTVQCSHCGDTRYPMQACLNKFLKCNKCGRVGHLDIVRPFPVVRVTDKPPTVVVSTRMAVPSITQAPPIKCLNFGDTTHLTTACLNKSMKCTKCGRD
jgi:hypothetical protein